jgi:radical SAM protein (TIGR04043 family)
MTDNNKRSLTKTRLKRGNNLNPTLLKIELLCRGARTKEDIDKGRKSGAGPTGGRYFTLKDGTCIEVPLQGRFVQSSPYTLAQANQNWLILRDNQPIAEMKLVSNPRFYEKTTSDGVSMGKVAVLHGKDCLASTVYSKCIYWSQQRRCKFCGIELGHKKRLTLKKPHQLGEVAKEAFKEGVAKHITLTTGTPPGPDKGALLLAEATRGIKEYVNLPVHVQLEPPEDKKFLEILYEAGVDTIGIHVESFDKKVLSEVCPMKTDVNNYFKAWKDAVQIFGENQVSTFIIAGLGETDTSILKGAEKLARIGVVPYLLPLRPIAGTAFENARPPRPQRMAKLYREVCKILHDYGVDPQKNKAGCVRCNACSALTEAFTKGIQLFS